jgi:hypothetical protein
VELEQRFKECAGREVADIAAAFEDDDQDDVTKALVSIIAGRTERSRLPERPYRVGLTLYGDAGVSDWTISYTDAEAAVEPSADAGTTHIETRWEHWEDAVRLINGDLSALSLFYARRITIGDEATTDNEPAWLRAVDFAPGSPALAENRVLTNLIIANEEGQKRREAYVGEVGVPAIAEARTLTTARALLESGCAEELKGSYMAVTIADEPSAPAVAVFEPTKVTAGSAELTSGPGAGVVLRYVNRQALLDGATGTRTFQDLLVNGLVKVEGGEDDRARFARTLMNFARLHGI